MKNIQIIIALSFIFITSVNAQKKDKLTPEQKATAQTEQMQAELNLKPSQKEKVQAILLENEIQKAEIKKAEKELKKKKKAVKEAKKEGLKKVLTAAQYEKYKENNKQQKAKDPTKSLKKVPNR